MGNTTTRNYRYSTLIALFGLLWAILGSNIAYADHTAEASAETTSAASYTFRPYTATYKVKASGFSVGKALFSLERLPSGLWKYSSDLKPSGIVRMFTKEKIFEEATFDYIGGRVVPMGYRYIRSGNAKKAEDVEIDYNWEDKLAVFKRNGDTQIIPLTDQHQDRYSVITAIISDIAQGASSLSYHILDKRMKTRTYERGETEQVKLPKLGKKPGIKVYQTDKSSRSVNVWLSPEDDYLPLRIEQRRKGKIQVLMLLESIDWKD